METAKRGFRIHFMKHLPKEGHWIGLSRTHEGYATHLRNPSESYVLLVAVAI